MKAARAWGIKMPSAWDDLDPLDKAEMLADFTTDAEMESHELWRNEAKSAAKENAAPPRRRHRPPTRR